MAISVRDVTDVDRRTARRLGMDADKVNLVINVWAEEYLAVEKVHRQLTEAMNPEPTKPARKRAPRKVAAKATTETSNGEQSGD